MEKLILEKLKPGVKARVTERVKEKGKERLSNFEGILIARKHGWTPGATFTLRNVIAGVGVEKTFPIYSPNLAAVKVLSLPKKTRRAKLYFLRRVSKKKSREKIGL